MQVLRILGTSKYVPVLNPFSLSARLDIVLYPFIDSYYFGFIPLDGFYIIKTVRPLNGRPGLIGRFPLFDNFKILHLHIKK